MTFLTRAALAASLTALVALAPALPAAAGSGDHGDRTSASQTVDRPDHSLNRLDRGDHHGWGDRDDHGGRRDHDGWGGRGDHGDRHGRGHGHHHGDHDRPSSACAGLGYQNLVRAETGIGFSSRAECVQHGALGGSYSLLTVDTSAQYPCDSGTCWGVLIGQGLQPVSEVIVNWSGGPGGSGEFAAFADNEGDVDDTALNLACGASISDVRAMGTTSGGLSIMSTVATAPC